VKVAAASPTQKRDAERKLAQGTKLFEKGKFDEAIARFRASHDSVADPKASLMIADALRNTGDLLTARAEYQRARAEAEEAIGTDEKYRSTLSKVREKMDELEGVLGRLSITVFHAPEGTEVTVDGELVPVTKLGEPVYVAPGSVTVEATAPDGTIARRVVSVNAGQSAGVELPFSRRELPQALASNEPEARREEPAAPSSGDGRDHTLAFVAGGVGIAGIATFAVFGALANSKLDELETSCPGGHCTPDYDDDITAGKRFQTIANVGLGVGIAGAVTSVALFVFGGGSDVDAPKQSATARVGIGIGSIEVRGSFQ